MNNEYVYSLVCKFKNAILEALNSKCFHDDIVFHRFPYACCGDTCCLLAEYLHTNGIETLYVCGTNEDLQSHAWLVLKDYRVKEPAPRYYEYSDEEVAVMKFYGASVIERKINTSRYEWDDIMNGIFIDITADQFGQESIYFDVANNFYNQFEFDFAREYMKLNDSARLCSLYGSIMKYIKPLN